MKTRFSRSAEADLESIGDFIAADNPRRAVSFVAEIRKRCRRLARFPRSGPSVPRHEESGMRQIVHGSYLIFYRISDQDVEVLRILHGARDTERMLFPERAPGHDE